jgi:hypothetical protein
MMMSRFYKHLPLANFIVASSALTFQVTVLHPWHNELSQQIKEIDKKLNKK